ncbi:hypothetical protein CLU79DRAFT_764067, partial [Phycomyces nitens]
NTKSLTCGHILSLAWKKSASTFHIHYYYFLTHKYTNIYFDFFLCASYSQPVL